jgi:hypothetical protein
MSSTTSGQSWVAKDVKRIDPAARSTKPYGVDILPDSLGTTFSIVSGSMVDYTITVKVGQTKEALTPSFSIVSGIKNLLVKSKVVEPETITCSFSIQSGVLNTLVKAKTVAPESLTPTFEVVSGGLSRIVYYYERANEELSVSFTIVSGVLNE